MNRHTKKTAFLLAAAVLSSALTLGASGSGLGKSSFIKSEDMSGVTREETGSLLSENFYAYVNFDRFKDEAIPYGESEKMLAEDWTQDACVGILQELVTHNGEYARGTNEQKISDFCAQVQDEETRNKVGIAPLEGILSKIEGAASVDELIKIAVELQWDYGVATFLKFRVGAGMYDSSVYSVAHTQMNMPVNPEEFFDKYGTADSLQKGVKDVLAKRGGSDVSERARKTVDILYEISENSLRSTDIFFAFEDYEEITFDEFLSRFSVDMSPYTDRLREYGCDRITIADVGQFKAETRLLTEENFGAWKDYMTVMVITEYANHFPEAEAAVLVPFGVRYKLPEAEEICEFVYNEMAYMFVQRYVDYQLIESAKSFTADIIEAYEQLIRDSESVDDATKERFISKLQNMYINIDVPDKPYDGHYDWVPASEGGDYLSNMIRRNSGTFRTKLENIGKPFDKTAYDWEGMPPQVFGNAQYHTSNYVTIPYATLTDPYYNANGDRNVNLGFLGFIIGHEISHGFDSHGMRYNEYGNYDPSWISGDYEITLEQKKADITALYDKQKLFGVYPLDGAKTLGENMADIASMQCMMKLAVTPEQRKTFFESYAKNWYILIYDASAYEQLYADEHALNEFRANVVVSQMDEFYEIFDITDGNMFTPPEERRRVW